MFQGDIVLVSCDLVTTIPLQTIMLFHHTHNSTVTALLNQPPQAAEDVVRKKNTGAVIERDLIGLTEESRVVLFSSEADLEENLELSRSMLQQ